MVCWAHATLALQLCHRNPLGSLCGCWSRRDRHKRRAARYEWDVEFNLQAGTEIMWVLRDNLALSLETRYVYWSCAGLHQPNSGLNGLTELLGITYFF
jgi:hypothetical protein